MAQTRVDALDAARTIVHRCLERDFCTPIDAGAERPVSDQLSTVAETLTPLLIAMTIVSVASIVAVLAWLEGLI